MNKYVDRVFVCDWLYIELLTLLPFQDGQEPSCLGSTTQKAQISNSIRSVHTDASASKRCPKLWAQIPPLVNSRGAGF